MAVLLHLLRHVDAMDYRVNVLFIFQAAEEVFAGARALLEDVKSFPIDYLYALHVTPNLYAGLFSLSPDQMMAANLTVEWELELVQGHSAEQTDFLELFAALHQFQTGFNTSDHVCRVTHVETNGYYNITPSTMKLYVNYRAREMEQNRAGHEQFAAVVAASPVVQRVRRADIVSEYPPLQNDPELNLFTTRVLQKRFGESRVLKCPFLFSSDDFAFYGHHLSGVKTCYFFIGSYLGDDITVHRDNFDLDENCLVYGYEGFKAILQVMDHSQAGK
jgi:metal-dependent amidase/aminoacylase/carboxypeptidase family protein